ncbi:MAG: 1-acyl-sn-glycerol-3-phosphate acyltransferase [Vicingaceae bacterium]|nr:1-acyl-sn-glycerol-3-phosphate acyltransferase [Vicingaceae bacterium]
MSYNFEDIRPYNDDEYHQVVNELLEVAPLQKAIKYYLPTLSFNEVKQLLNSFNTVQEFQSDMACRLVQAIIDDSIEDFSYDGVLALDKDKTFLLMSNHRDIVLDSALINYCLNDRKRDTCEIAIGSNLLREPWVKKLVRLNKSFIVKRNVPKHDMLDASKTLSSYIKYALHDKKQSVWIAQREGRAKDGNDKTNPGLLKMFGLTNEGDLLDYIISLNITPVSISYEKDPCDYLKIPELLAKERGEKYEKFDGEDDMHMALGMKGDKGRVHVQFTKPINIEIEKLRIIKNRNELLKGIADVIDKTIYEYYKLWDTNFIAYDLLRNSSEYKDKYTDITKDEFIFYMKEKLKKYEGSSDAKRLFLSMYANPLINRLEN